METKVVLYPPMGVSHMIPMIQLAKLFINNGVAVDIVVINSTIMPTATTKLISQVSSTNPQISFNLLPPLPPLDDAPTPFANMCNIIRSNNIMLPSYLQSQSNNKSIAALVLDPFCVDALDVATELDIPAYIFCPSGANNLAVFLTLPELDSTWDRTKKDFGRTPIVIPGVPLLHASDLPTEASKLDGMGYKIFINLCRRMLEAKGILVNTFQSLEHRAVMSLKDGVSLLTQPIPPIYFIGPLVTSPNEGGTHPCLRWLDAQPKKRVVFLSFGSMGKFSVEQLREIAFGIEKSGQKFLWVVRNPPSDDPKKLYDPLAEPDLNSLLPEGFLDRTKEQGIVLKSWAPQVEILHHESVGGFVSHCGWSSVLEAINNAVPVICWPLFAEQRINRVLLVEEMKIGVELKGCDEGLVSRDEMAEKVKWLIESEGGKELRDNVIAHRINGYKALREGGSSEAAFLDFLGNLELQSS